MQLWGPKHTRDKISFLPANIEGSLSERREADQIWAQVFEKKKS